MFPPVNRFWSVSPRCSYMPSPQGAVDGVSPVFWHSQRNESGPAVLLPGSCDPGSPLSQADMRTSAEPCCPLTRAVMPPTGLKTTTQRPELYVKADTG